MPPIHVLIKPASGLCNLRCSYCFYADEMAHRDRASYGLMSQQTLAVLVKKALDYAEGSCTFAFQGGEPTLAGLPFYQTCLQLVQQYNQKGVQVDYALQTNGFLLDVDWCAFLAKHDFLVGLSVDGIASTHDAFRRDPQGQGTYHHTLQAARLLQSAGVRFNVLTVVNSRTAPNIGRIYQQYRKLGFDWQQYIACLDPLQDCRKPYSLTPAAYGRFLIELFTLWAADVRRGKQPYIRQFENYLAILLGRQPESCEQRGCCALQYVVEADGSVYPCDFYTLDAHRLGNLLGDDLPVLQQRFLDSDFYKTAQNQTAACRACRYFALCRGGCRRHREHPTLPVGQNYFCESYKAFFAACLPELQRIAVACQG